MRTLCLHTGIRKRVSLINPFTQTGIKHVAILLLKQLLAKLQFAQSAAYFRGMEEKWSKQPMKNIHIIPLVSMTNAYSLLLSLVFFITSWYKFWDGWLCLGSWIGHSTVFYTTPVNQTFKEISSPYSATCILWLTFITGYLHHFVSREHLPFERKRRQEADPTALSRCFQKFKQ